MALSLAEILGSEGPLARALPGYTARPQQIEMAEHVAAALQERTQLVVEAGTGTGKTFAYLVPALLSGRKIIVSTGTRALQDQLFHRDLPTICAAIGRPARIALLKGRANYLCRHRLDMAEQQAYARGLRKEVATALPRVRSWSYTTKRGDVGELPGIGEQDPVWPWVTSTRENCLGAECPKFEECFVLAARREAQAADIVVVNHYLLMADLVLKEEGFGDLLPGADAIVIDEAHQLPDVAAQFLGYSVSTRQLAAISKDVAGATDGGQGRRRAERSRCADCGRAGDHRRPGGSTRAHGMAGPAARGVERARRARQGTGRCHCAARRRRAGRVQAPAGTPPGKRGSAAFADGR
jgi:ATP-dependent DNA helicase DinG